MTFHRAPVNSSIAILPDPFGALLLHPSEFPCPIVFTTIQWVGTYIKGGAVNQPAKHKHEFDGVNSKRHSIFSSTK
jgi:hypothetical protein